jgi:predicted nucleotidyltransferase component of viral defense system
MLIETLRDNVASKMVALVERGAPRDLRDVYELCTRELLTIDECWQLWREKTSRRDDREGRDKVLFHVARLELQRPLERIASPHERESAATLRQWFTRRFCAAGDIS